MSHQMSGDAVCDVPSCGWRVAVTVQGGQVEFGEEAGRRVAAHLRSAHPWLFAVFAPIEGLPVWACSRCGAAVADTEAHGRWHETGQV